MLRRLLIVLCLLAVVLAIGFWLYSRKARPTEAEKTADVSPPPAATAASPPPHAETALPPPAETITDFRAALEQARSLRDPKLRSREFGRILRLWLDRDLEAALVYLRELPKTSDAYTEGLLLSLETVVQTDPERALRLARELVVTREQQAIYSSLFAQFAQQNLPTALQRLAQVPPGEGRENAIRALVDRWVRTDLAGALAWAEALADSSDRATAFEVVLTEMAGKDPLQTIDLAQKTLTGPALDRTVFNALQKLVETDPRGAAGLVRLLPAGELQTLAAVDVARALALQDVEAALAWAKTLTAENVRSLATKRALEIWAANDAAAASRYVAGLPAGPEQRDAAAVLAIPLATANPQTAIAWAQSLPTAEARPVALAAIADTWAQNDPAAATRWVAEQSPGSLAALAPQTLNAALSYWVLQDAVAAQEFVRTLAPGAQGSAAEFLAPLLSQNNPAGTLAWAQSLSTPDARERALVAAYSRWRDNAPAAAQSWLSTAHLTSETKARLQTLP